MVVNKTDQIELGVDDNINATYMIFKQQVNEDDFIEAHLELLDLLNTRKYTSGKHLVDTRKLKVITSYSSQWLHENIVPQIQNVSDDGTAYIAVVLGSNVFTDLGGEYVHSKFSESVHVHFFKDVEDAKRWLTPILQANYLRA